MCACVPGKEREKLLNKWLRNIKSDVVSLSKTSMIHSRRVHAVAVLSLSTQSSVRKKLYHSQGSPLTSAVWILSTTCEVVRAGTTATFTFEECTLTMRNPIAGNVKWFAQVT